MAKHLGVRYLYRELTAAGAVADATASDEDAGLRQALKALPASWGSQLRRATIVGDMAQIMAAIRAIREHGLEAMTATALTDELTQMANNFEHDRILAIIEQAG